MNIGKILLVWGLVFSVLPASTAVAGKIPSSVLGQPVLKSSQVPAVYIREWRKAQNRKHCAPLALTGLNHDGVTPRRASFSGGWGIAYDLPGQRSVYGVAGAGVDAEPFTPGVFPFEKNWSDGSKAYYGLEGGTGPGYLAYLKVAGQRCLYNVWSKQGKEHLEDMLDHLKLVRVN